MRQGSDIAAVNAPRSFAAARTGRFAPFWCELNSKAFIIILQVFNIVAIQIRKDRSDRKHTIPPYSETVSKHGLPAAIRADTTDTITVTRSSYPVPWQHAREIAKTQSHSRRFLPLTGAKPTLPRLQETGQPPNDSHEDLGDARRLGVRLR